MEGEEMDGGRDKGEMKGRWRERRWRGDGGRSKKKRGTDESKVTYE